MTSPQYSIVECDGQTIHLENKGSEWNFVALDDTGSYRAVYTVRCRDAIYVLHAFQKKSKTGVATPRKELDLIAQRLAAAERDHRERQN